MLSVLWIAAIVWGPGGAEKAAASEPPAIVRAETLTLRPIALGTPMRRISAGAPPEVIVTAGERESANGASGILVSQAIAVPANAIGGESQVTVVGASRRGSDGVAVRDGAADDGVIARTEQLFRAFGKGRYRNFGYSELLEPRQVGPFVGTPIFGPFGPGDGQPVTPPRQTQAEIDRTKLERIYQMFESLRPVEDRFPPPVGR